MTQILVFQNLEDCTQACSEVDPFYYNPPGTLRWANPTDIIFNDGTHAIEKPTKPEAIAAITPEYFEATFADLAVNPGRWFPPGGDQ